MDVSREGQSDDADAHLLSRYAAGDADASRLLAERLVPRMLSLAARMLHDAAEAEDVAQEAMLRLWRAAPGWRRDEARVSTWLYRVTVNLCTDHLRRRRSVPLDSIPDPPAPGSDTVERMTAEDRRAALRAALSELPERQREAVILRHVEGLSNPEIAEIMQIGIEAVESLTARGKRTLAARLAGRRDELGYGE